MKAVRTPDSDVTFTLTGPDGERIPDADLPAQRIMIYDGDRGETQQDAKLALETIWMPDEAEARRLEAGAAVCLRITSKIHPPVSLTVTDAVVPEAEMIRRGHVDRALGWLYGNLKVEIDARLDKAGPDVHQAVTAEDVLPDPAAFADLWAEAVKATMQTDDPAEEAKLQAAIDAAARERKNGGPS